MRLSLRSKLAAAQVALMLVLSTALVVISCRVTAGHFKDQLRDALARQCGPLRQAIAAEGLGPELEAGPELQALVLRYSSQVGARVTLIGPDGTVLADSEADVPRMENHAGRPEVIAARAQGIGSSVRHSATTGIDNLYVAESVGLREPTLRLALPLTSVHSMVNRLQGGTYAAAAVATIVAVAVAMWLTGALTESLASLARIARRLGQGDLTARAPVTASDETRELGEALNSMAAGLSDAMSDLWRTAAHLALILTQMAEGVLVVGADEVVVLMNPEAGRLLDTDPDHAVGRLLAEVVLQHEVYDLALRATRLRTALSQDVTASGDPPKTLAATAAPLRTVECVEGVVITLRDMSEVRRLQTVRQEFVANASHELRTPIAAIKSLAEALGSGGLNDPNAAGRFLERIVENTDSLARLLDDMMTLSELDEAPGLMANPETLNVEQTLATAAARLQPQAQAKSIDVSIDAEPDLAVSCSEHDLLAALVNLIDNAVKFSPEGGRVDLRATKDNGGVRITVDDTGPGIPERARERVFERFYRVDRARAKQAGGTGLGLSIAKHAIDLNHGRIWAEAAEDGGARLVVVLPSAPP
jgi:two-component system phosphate regulon sensor histidine kinase PhoR